jgi:hypothetical protein
MDGGTCTRSGTEQERPVCACLRRARDRSYKPMVKASGVQRESGGVVVPVIGVQHNAPGGKGTTDFGHAGRGGKREGMAEVPRSNHPGGPSPAVAVDGRPSVVKVRKLQRRLWTAAKQHEDRRFHALYDRIHIGECCGRRGNGSVGTEERLGWIGSPRLSWFNARGLYRLRGTVRIRRLRNPVKKTIGKPCAGKPHARIERGKGKQAHWVLGP